MKTKTEIIDDSFVWDYRNALSALLNNPSPNQSLVHTAKVLGMRAAESQMPISSLISLHFSELEQLANGTHKIGGQSDKLQLANAFLLDVLRLFEEVNQQETDALRSTLQNAEKRLEKEKDRYSFLHKKALKDQEQARLLTHQFLLAQEAERKEISRELHDQVAQILAGINVRLAALKKASSSDQQKLEGLITRTQLLVEQSVELVHSYARKLRPAMLDDLGLLPSLRTLIKDITETDSLKIKLEAFAKVEALDKQSRTVLFRIAQESLTNVVRHAEAKNASVRISESDGKVSLSVSDDGKSFPVEGILSTNTYKRLGLLGMRERVEMLGGTFKIDSKPGVGTTILAAIPSTRRDESKPNETH